MRSLVIACVALSGGCNALIDFGFKFGSDGGSEDGGSRDGGNKPDRDGGNRPVDGGDGRDASAPADGGGDGGGTQDAGPDASSCPSQSEDCSNDDDDDCDGLEDCRDPDCAEAPVCCRPNQIPETSCSGGIDNDCDQDVDCADSDCAVSPLCCTTSGPEVGMVNCMDGKNNDCDGLVDCAELSCKSQVFCCDAIGDENNATACSDNIDNDCDDAKDCTDDECFRTSACCTLPALPNETSCTDNNDEDCDGLADCADSDCTTNGACVGCVPSDTKEQSCGDGIDDDCDLNRDCRDSDCYNTVLCCTLRGSNPENAIGSCTDGSDNDCDGLTDCSDPDCSGQLFCCVVAPENTNEACTDTLDNDCDSKLNCGDDSCYGTVACCDETGPENSMAACTDRTDNDCDGLLDCSDPDCAGISACCGATSGGTTTLGIGCCTPDGMTEAAAPNDGRDNDCDGLIDKPVLNSAFPVEGLPSSGDEVRLEFMTEIDASARLLCRTRRVGATEPSTFTTCPMSGTFVKPFTASASTKPENNGLWLTEVRWQFGTNEVFSEVHTFKYYVHNTLHGAVHCPTPHTPAAWFAKAATRLGTKSAGTFNLGTDTFLASPFIKVKYQVPVSSSYQFNLNGQSPSINMWSLRRRFTLSADNQYLLITRNYRATRSGGCAAAGISVHNFKRGGGNNNAQRNYGCDAIVLNRAGVGVCMNAGSPSPVFPANTDQNDRYANMIGWDKANKFMWRNIIDAGGRLNFTFKCDTTPCPGGIYLPDSSHFGR